MKAFEYAAPSTKEQAVALLGDRWEEAAILAGGTDLLSCMKDNLMAPSRVVDIKGLRDLGGIEYNPQSGLRLGALVTFEQLREHPQVLSRYPGIVQAVEGVTSAQIRNRGSVGGDLNQRPRCWYYRNGFGLLAKDEQGRSLVVDGENRYHAILGNEGPAYFVNPSSLAPVLIALGARVRLFGPKGGRELPLEKFFTIPKTDSEHENVLQPNEILTEVLIPAGSWQTATYEVRQKEALDWPLAAASVALKLGGAQVQEARVVLGHVAPIPWRVPEAEKILTRKTITEEIAMEAGKAAVGQARPLSQNGYKVQLARVAVKRALLRAVQGGA
ncbi:MAG: xanthine dehydrogenase family protein subunit M [Acidobacteria bacterium]|nr:xanthine dehydrogenase family protein subunit M [Acidobacteriota bacterium]